MAPPVATSETQDLDELVVAFDGFVKAAKRSRARAEGTDGGTLTTSQADLLAPLLECEPVGLGLRALARLAGIAAPTATRMVDGLEARGLVTRRRDPDDGRAVLIALTADGEAALRERRAQMLARRRAMFELLTPSERRAAAKVLARLTSAFEGS
jgi:DNA-binding MarR family transcriptional regulator